MEECTSLDVKFCGFTQAGVLKTSYEVDVLCFQVYRKQCKDMEQRGTYIRI